MTNTGTETTYSSTLAVVRETTVCDSKGCETFTVHTDMVMWYAVLLIGAMVFFQLGVLWERSTWQSKTGWISPWLGGTGARATAESRTPGPA